MMRMSQVVDEQQDVGSGVGPADADVVELAAVAEGDGAGGVDDVAADAVVGVGGAVAGGGFGPGGVGGGGGGPVRQGPVRPLGVVVAGEVVEQGLQLGEVAGWGGWAASHFLRVCQNRSTLPWVWGWFGRPFFWVMPRRRSSCSRPLRPPLPPEKRVVKTIPLSVRVEAGSAVGGDRGAEGGHDDGAGDPRGGRSGAAPAGSGHPASPGSRCRCRRRAGSG